MSTNTNHLRDWADRKASSGAPFTAEDRAYIHMVAHELDGTRTERNIARIAASKAEAREPGAPPSVHGG